MTNPNKTLIVFVLDRSSSMGGVLQETISGFNEFLAQQKAVPGDECFCTLVQFSNEVETTFSSKPVHAVEPLTTYTYHPHGMTALFDAIGTAVDETGAALAALPDANRPGKVVVCIITDGEENNSRRYSAGDVQEKIKHQTDVYNWNFVFIGANQDAITAGARLGVSAKTSLTYDASAKGMEVMYQTLSSNVSSYRSTKSAATLNFTQAQRNANAGQGNVVITGIDPDDDADSKPANN